MKLPNIKREFLIILVICFTIPSVAFASWWNPFTWKIFSLPLQVKYEKSIVSPINTVSSSNTILEQSKTNNESVEIKKLKKEVENLKNIPTKAAKIKSEPTGTSQNNYLSPMQPLPKPTASIVPSNTTFCNGANWNKCPDGQDFVCPAIGNAYCQYPPSQSSQQQAPPYTAPVPLNENISTEVAARNNALNLYSNSIANFGALKSMNTADIAGMNNIANVITVSGTTDQATLLLLKLTRSRLDRMTQAQDSLNSLINSLKAEEATLQSQPLSYFASYKISSFVSDSSKFETAYSTMVADEDSYSKSVNMVVTSLASNASPSNTSLCKEIEAQPIASSFINGQKVAANCP